MIYVIGRTLYDINHSKILFDPAPREREKNYNQDYSTWQGSHSGSMERSKALQTSKSYENSAPPNQLYNKC